MKQTFNLGGKWEFLEIKPETLALNDVHISKYYSLVESPSFINSLRKRSGWLMGRVPGDVWQDLIRVGKIGNPYKELNWLKFSWIEKRIWVYRKTFNIRSVQADRVDLVFDGLDCITSIILNDHVIGRTNNMFCSWRFDVSDKIVEGRNELIVVFYPWESYVSGKKIDKPMSVFNSDRVFIRRAQMETGWDWGPRIVLSGIWRGCRVEFIDKVRIRSWHFRTVKISQSQAVVEVEVDLDKTGRFPVDITVSIRKGRKYVKSIQTKSSQAILRFRLDNPKLWWPWNVGKPNLYDVKIEVYFSGELVDTLESKGGIRTVRLVQRKQSGGCRSFTFEINGRKIFCGGANWIPADSLLSSVSSERYRRLVLLAKRANMNILRVWGGGIYEDEEFYRICDEEGVMVWQDFMFACAIYPAKDKEFINTIKYEFEEVIKRLRPHPSIVLWNGNNEIYIMGDYLYWNDRKFKLPDRDIYERILPEYITMLDGTRPYIPSSPIGGNDHNDWREGNMHYWAVWSGMKLERGFGENPAEEGGRINSHYSQYEKLVPRFVSEYGIQAVPYKETLGKYLAKDQMKLMRKTLIERNKIPCKNLEALRIFLDGITGWAKDYDELELKSQFAQWRGLEVGTAHFKRNLWDCSGAIIWQLNDCWPGFSWSLVDYHLLPKPAYFAVKRVFAPKMVSVYRTDKGKVQVRVVNLAGKEWKPTVKVTVGRFTDQRFKEYKTKISVPSDTSVIAIKDLFKKIDNFNYDPQSCFIKAEVVGDRRVGISWLIDDPVNINLPSAKVGLKLSVRKISEGRFHHELIAKSLDNFVLFFGIIPPSKDVVFEDNFVNIEPKGKVKITFTAQKRYSLDKLRVRWYNR